MKKVLVCLCSLLACLLLVAGCGGGGGSKEPAKAEKKSAPKHLNVALF